MHVAATQRFVADRDGIEDTRVIVLKAVMGEARAFTPKLRPLAANRVRPTHALVATND